jgi:hypothetical protein
MMAVNKCPICQNIYGGQFTNNHSGTGNHDFTCTMCGKYKISGSAISVQTLKNLKPMERASLSHAVQSNQKNEEKIIITTYWLTKFLDNVRLPSPARQAASIIKLIGDIMMETGCPMPVVPDQLYTMIGSPNPEFANDIFRELVEQGSVQAIFSDGIGGYTRIQDARLTLTGWEVYEQELRGKNSSKIGFIALKFNDPELDSLLEDIIKPSIKEVGFVLIDLRDIAQPGIIDNILRDTIRQAPFVLVDLTHDNSGAYWEAGFAEGLGKPVLYICEQTKFDEKKTHFDTAHCTTVTWGGKKTPDEFSKALKATLRNSLVIFPNKED